MRGSKDAALSVALRAALNARLSAIGEIADLSLDTAARSVRVRLLLRGERDPVDVHVREFVLDHADGRDWLTLVDATSSRAWLAASIEQFAIGRAFPIPRAAARALRLLA